MPDESFQDILADVRKAWLYRQGIWEQIDFPSLLPTALPGHAGDEHIKRSHGFAITSVDMRLPVIYNCRTS